MFHEGRQGSHSTTADRAPTSEVTSLVFFLLVNTRVLKMEGRSHGDFTAVPLMWVDYVVDKIPWEL